MGWEDAEEVAAQLATNMQDLGHAVDVISTCRRSDLHGQPYRIDVWNGIRVWRIAPWNLYLEIRSLNPSSSSYSRAQPGILWIYGIHLQSVHCEQYFKKYGRISSTRTTLMASHQQSGRWLANLPAVVHTLHDYHLLCPRAILQRRDGTLCESLCTSCRAYTAFNRIFEHYVDAVIAPSKAVADLHEAAGWRRPVLIPNAVALEEIELPARGSDDPLEVVFMSRLVPEKGCETLLRIYRGTFPRLPPYSFSHVAGKGPQAEHFQGLVGYRTNFTWHGFVAGRGKTSLLCVRETFFLQLSEFPENAPLAVLEAKQCGLHLVGVNIGGIPELISNDMEGRLISPS